MQQGWLRCETCRSVAPHPKARWSGCGRRGTLRSKKPRRWRSTIAISVMSKATSVRSKLPTKFWAERTFNPKQEASMSDRYIPTPHDGQYRPEDLINGRRDAEERCNPHPFNSPAWHVWNAGYPAAVSHVVGKIAHHRSAGEGERE